MKQDTKKLRDYKKQGIDPFNREGSRSCAKTGAITRQSIEFIRFASLWIDLAIKKSGVLVSYLSTHRNGRRTNLRFPLPFLGRVSEITLKL
jgi:hypothetical protein